MYKLKTNKAAAKRFKFTKSGKVKRAGAFMRHILSKKSPKRKRKLGGTIVLSDREVEAVKKLLPYGG